MPSLVPKVIGKGVLNLERVQAICPACGQQVEAVASNGWVKGYCAIAKQSVDFLIEIQRTAETKTEISAGLTPMRKGRDSRGHFVKGNVPLNKRGNSTRCNDLPYPSSVYNEGMSRLPGLYNEIPTYHPADCTIACIVA